jgi:excisionase family DNA binding protein
MLQAAGPVRGANVRATAKAYGIPLPHLRRAIKANELRAYCTGGRTNILLWSEVDEWVRVQPAPSRTRMRKQPEATCHG